MKEEAVFVVQIVGDKTQRVSNSIGDFRRLSVTAMVTNAQAGQTESGGRDARHGVRIITIRQSAVFYLPSFQASFIPKEFKTDALYFFEQLLVGSLERRAVGLHKRWRTAILATTERYQRRGHEAHSAEAHHFPSIQKSFSCHGCPAYFVISSVA